MVFRSDLRFTSQLGLCLLATLCFCSSVFAFQVQDKDDLPTAEEVIERHILAKGGYEVLSSISTMRTRWTKKKGDQLWSYERWRVPGKKFAQQGLNGNITWTYGCWVANPTADVKSLKGIAWKQSGASFQMKGGLSLQEDLDDTASIDDATRWLDRNKSIVVKGKEQHDGKDCYVLEFTNADDEVTTRYFDIETCYKVREIGISHTEGGEVLIRSYWDFKEIDGIVIAMKQRVDSDAGAGVWEVQEFEHDTELDFDELPLPNEALIAIHRMKNKLQLASEAPAVRK